MEPVAINVLLVEDSPSDADVLQHTLNQAGEGRFQFTWVERLDDALASLASHAFDVVLLDLSLPDSSGPETFRRVRQAAPRVPILLLTGLDDEGLGLAAIQEGVQDYLVKGRIDGPQIARAIRYAIGRNYAEEQLRHQREVLQVTLTSIGDAVLATDVAGRITFINPVAAKLTGWTEPEALGQPIGDVFRIRNENTRENAADIVARVLREGQIVHLANYTALRTRDGREIPIEDSAAPIRASDGKTAGVVLVFHDVTERRRAQDALRESERQFRNLANSIPQLCWMANPDGFIFWYSDRWYEYTGATPGQMEGWGWQAVHDPEVLPMVLEKWNDSLATGNPFDMVFPLRGADGLFRPFLTRVVPVRDRDGRVIRWFGTNTDISEQRTAEEELRRSEERYRLLFSTLIEAFCIVDVIFGADGTPRDARILETNPAFELQTGLKNVRGRLIVHLTREQQARWFEKIGQVALTGRPTRFVSELKALNRWYDVSAYRLGGAESRRVAILFNDITEAATAQKALAESESRFRALLESASQAVVAVDETGRIVLVNAQTEQMFGYAREELLGRNLDVLLPERSRAAHAGHLRHYFAQPRTRVMGLGLDLHGITKTGSEFPLEITLSCIEHGVRWAMALITDITERKKAEDRLFQAQKLESIGLLAGGIAHDFNNLLVGVIGNTSLVQDMLPPDHHGVDLLQRVLATGEQLAHLTRQMLAYAGKGRFIVEPLDLSALVPSMSDLVRPCIPKKVGLHFELQPDLPLIDADRGQVQQAFMNLVLNAAEAMNDRGGRITVRTGVQALDRACRQSDPGLAELHPGNYVYLEVRDTGCGMTEATRARIFDPFFTTKFTGRGLGLAAVAGIVRGHKGAITVSSSPGRGSCFRILLPAVQASAPVPSAPPADVAFIGSGTVLIVDDEAVVRTTAKLVLERYGYQVLLADGAPAAIDIFKRHPGEISLVVLDLSMPGMGGEEALPELRKIRSGVKVVISSGYTETDAMRMFAGQRVSAFLQKPFTPAQIAEKVKKALA